MQSQRKSAINTPPIVTKWVTTQIFLTTFDLQWITQTTSTDNDNKQTTQTS